VVLRARYKGICDNHLTIRRDELETRVLKALQDRLLNQELLEEFCEEFTREMNRLRMEHRASITSARREVARIGTRIKKLLNLMLDDEIAVDEGKAEMKALDGRRKELEAQLKTADEPPPLLHPEMARIYRSKVMELAKALQEPERRIEATEALRALVDAIVLTPAAGTNVHPSRSRRTQRASIPRPTQRGPKAPFAKQNSRRSTLADFPGKSTVFQHFAERGSWLAFIVTTLFWRPSGTVPGTFDRLIDRCAQVRRGVPVEHNFYLRGRRLCFGACLLYRHHMPTIGRQVGDTAAIAECVDRILDRKHRRWRSEREARSLPKDLNDAKEASVEAGKIDDSVPIRQPHRREAALPGNFISSPCGRKRFNVRAANRPPLVEDPTPIR
jgi:hypothetical protein